jgi:hypothetical protein
MSQPTKYMQAPRHPADVAALAVLRCLNEACRIQRHIQTVIVLGVIPGLELAVVG